MYHIDAHQFDAYNISILNEEVNVLASLPREWLVVARKKEGFTQEEVADKIGITRTAYARYETGERTPTPSVAEKIGTFLNVSKEYFFWPPQYQFDAKKE